MRKLLLGLATFCVALPAAAALPVGAHAPEFVTNGAVGGKAFRLDLNEQLRNVDAIFGRVFDGSR